MAKDGVIVGDDTPDNHKEDPVEEPRAEESEEQPEEEPKAETKEEKLLAGKFKTAEDLEKSYSELEKKMGEQGNKLGEYEKEKSVLMRQLEQMQEKTREAAPEDTGKAEDLNAKLQEISRAVEEGEISISEGMVQTASITSQMAQENTLKSVEERAQQETLATSQAKFAEENADFFETQQSGELEAIKQQYPGFHDDVSAYFAKKAMDSQSALESAVEAARNEGFEAGKAEMAKLADGDKNTRKVLQTPGGTAKSIGKKEPGNYSKTELRSSGLEALKRARGG